MVARVLSISHVPRLEPLIRSPWGRCNCLPHSWRSINGSIEERGHPRDNPSVGSLASLRFIDVGQTPTRYQYESVVISANSGFLHLVPRTRTETRQGKPCNLGAIRNC